MSDEQTSILLLASDWQTAQTQFRPVPRWKFLGLTTEGNTTIRRYSVILDDSQKPEDQTGQHRRTTRAAVPQGEK
jgi:hypothetical protein